MSSLKLCLLGSPRLERDGKPLKLEPRKNIALLTYLAVTGESHSRETLITLLWPELEPSRARAGLRRNLSILKKTLSGEWLLVDREIIGLDRDADAWMDVDQFHQLLQAWQTHGHPETGLCADCLTILTEAVELYREDFLAGFTLRDSPNFDEWQFFQAESLRQELASALERLVRGHSAQGEYEIAIPHARRWLALDPLHEVVHRQLMQLYAQTDQRAAALRQYAECERLLQEELDVPPDEETVQLYRALKEQRALPPSRGPVTPSRQEPPDQPSKASVVAQRERYRLERKVGQGAMGEVWLATDTILDRPVALKFPEVISARGVEQLLQEARLLASLNHPNITAIHDFFIDPAEERFYLVMEYVDGKVLSDLIKGEQPLPLDLILEIMRGVLQALGYAHRQGVVHRDVKPGNVMIAADVKLADFGLASVASLLEKSTGFLTGTPAYIAPEQVEGRPTDGRADLYSLGVMLFEMITGGQLPFAHTDENEMMQAHLHASPPPLSQFVPTVPPALENIIIRLLAKDPADRHPSAEALLNELDAIPVGPKLSNLPLPLTLTPFVGREAALVEIRGRLQDPACRLLTLVGPGGIGKTRLALEAARDLIEAPSGETQFPHGVHFVSLAPISSTASLVATIAEALNFSFYSDVAPRRQLLDYLRRKEMLLVLDNFEHLLSPPLSLPGGRTRGGASAEEVPEGGLKGETEQLGATELLIDILTTAPAVKILVTSREVLNLQGEWLFPVDGLPFPPGDATESRDTPTTLEVYSAVQLFEQCARRAQPGFSLAAERKNVVRICQMVEGMPLGIELAAAWLKMFPCEKITRELERGLDLLTTSLKDVPDRHRSIQAVFEHSWRLLTEEERRVLRQTSVFRGGFRQEAAEQVTDATFSDLVALVEKSLLRLTPARRYQVHELLRQFAAEKLQAISEEKEAVQNRHSDYYLAFLQQREETLKGKQQQTALAEIGEEIENVRAAWNWAVAQDKVEVIDQALESLYDFYSMRSRFQEGQEAFSRATKCLQAQARPQSEIVLTKTLARQGAFVSLSLYEAAGELLQKSLAMAQQFGMRSEMAFCLNFLGRLMLYRGDVTEAERLVQESLVINRELGDLAEIAFSLLYLGEIVDEKGEYLKAEQLYRDGLTIAREIGRQDRIAYLLDKLGWLALIQGKYIESEQYYRESLAIFKGIGDRIGIAKALPGVALAAWQQDPGDRTKGAEAQAAAKKSLAISREVGGPTRIAERLGLLGKVAYNLGEYQEAQEYYRECLVISRESGYSWGLISAPKGLGQVACRLEDFQKARRYLRQSLETAMSTQLFPTVLDALGIWATVLVKEVATLDEGSPPREEKKAQAVELLALVLHHPASFQLYKDRAARLLAELEAELPPEVAAALERGKIRKLDEVVAEILAEG